jgi:hypothetical protein
MAETRNHETKSQAPPENPRKAIREARARRLRVIDGPPAIKVYAASEDLRAVLRHANGTRFRSSLDHGVEWPDDSFTARRLADGSVRASPASGEQDAPDPTKNPREQAAANKPKPAATKSESKPKQQQPQPQSAG